MNFYKLSKLIEDYKKEIENINAEIVSISLSMEKLLNEIGVLTNDKNDVEKRKEILLFDWLK